MGSLNSPSHVREAFVWEEEHQRRGTSAGDEGQIRFGWEGGGVWAGEDVRAEAVGRPMW